jgi:hypothetical protein
MLGVIRGTSANKTLDRQQPIVESDPLLDAIQKNGGDVS